MITVEDLYREDITEKILTVSGGKELRGPCPGCAGTDRFGVFPRQNDGRGSYYCGRQKGGGNGCGKGGDAIQYLRDFRGMSYKEACDHLGIETRGGSPSSSRFIPPVPKRKQSGENQQRVYKGHPQEVVDPAKWREHGMKFVNACHKALLDRPTAIAYLMARGIPQESIEKFKLGFHHGETRGNKQYEPSFRPWPSWGLSDELNDKKKIRKLMLPAGIVIPEIENGILRSIDIRLIKKDPRQPKKKYHLVKGSIKSAYIINPDARAFVLQEAKLDCIAVDAAAGDLVGSIALGGVTPGADIRITNALANSICILGALDFEKRYNKQKGQMESAGGSAGRWWEKNYSHYTRWPVPEGKDPGEAFENGVDLREWICAGLPEWYLEQKGSQTTISNECIQAPNPKEQASQKREAVLEPKTEQGVPEDEGQQVSDFERLRLLLLESGGEIRVYNDGNALGFDIDQNWSVDNPEKRREITDLVHRSETVGAVIETLEDGIYGPMDIKSWGKNERF